MKPLILRLTEGLKDSGKDKKPEPDHTQASSKKLTEVPVFVIKTNLFSSFLCR